MDKKTELIKKFAEVLNQNTRDLSEAWCVLNALQRLSELFQDKRFKAGLKTLKSMDSDLISLLDQYNY